MNAHLLVVVLTGIAAAAPAQTQWSLCGAAARVRVAAATAIELQGPRATARGPVTGECRVHFGADAAGKPSSLAFAVPDGAEVSLAVDVAGPAAVREVALTGPDWTESAGTDTVRTTGSPEDCDYRVEVDCEVSEATNIAGVVARWRSANEFYAFVCDRARGEVRIERHLGGDAFVLARAPASTSASGSRRLALQVQGFRLQALVDDEVVLQLFDGALSKGACGLCWRGAPPAWHHFTVAPPAIPRASTALVRGPGCIATVHAATMVTPGHWHVLELRLDRPHALLPLDEAGLEPWLLMRPAAPFVLRTDLLGALGAHSFGEVPSSGNVSHPVEWPDLPALRGQVAMVQLVLVTADGSAISATTPAVPLRF